MISPVELCDDGDRNNGDGCDDTCMIETGFTCPQAGQPCIADANCGNSVLNTG